MPYTEQSLPFARGSSTSYKAAQAAVERRGPKTRRYLQLLRERGPQTDHEAAHALRLPVSSVCSIRNGAIHCELVRRGVEERKSEWGRDCATWELTEGGRRAVERSEGTR